jgi:hypothetical protein
LSPVASSNTTPSEPKLTAPVISVWFCSQVALFAAIDRRHKRPLSMNTMVSPSTSKSRNSPTETPADSSVVTVVALVWPGVQRRSVVALPVVTAYRVLPLTA